jgi:hypothetical protein
VQDQSDDVLENGGSDAQSIKSLRWDWVVVVSPRNSGCHDVIRSRFSIIL